jgi:drug/metabolite transporter (DMT)-like permease
MIHFLALLGVLAISFSAVFVRLASVSPVTATFFRGAYALPLLAVIDWFRSAEASRDSRRPSRPDRGAEASRYAASATPSDGRISRERWLALASGVILAVDLNLWHESIALVGAGLGTVIANVQVVFVALAAWLLYGERQSPGRIATIAGVLGGVAMTSGLARPGAYGARPVAGAWIGVLAGLCYAAFLLVYRQANRSRGPASGPLLDSTLGLVAGALACAPLDRHFTLTPGAAAHVWLGLLAIVSQVIGWLFIGTALPRLSVVETSVLLLGQPVFAVIWGVIIFGEHFSRVQWIGSAIVLAGVGRLSVTSRQSSVVSPKSSVASLSRQSQSSVATD